MKQHLIATGALACAVLFATAPAVAQQVHHQHAGHHAEAPKGKSKKQCDCCNGVEALKKAVKRMHQSMNIAYTGNADVDFARGMVPHHQGAVEMAKAVLMYGKDADLKALAERIIIAQEQEILQMSHWLSTKGSGKIHAYGSKDASIAAYNKAMEAMHHGMMVNYTGNADLDFINGMIPHHQGAIDMAHIQLKYGKDAWLNELSDNIITGQSSEIAMMERIRDRLTSKK